MMQKLKSMFCIRCFKTYLFIPNWNGSYIFRRKPKTWVIIYYVWFFSYDIWLVNDRNIEFIVLNYNWPVSCTLHGEIFDMPLVTLNISFQNSKENVDSPREFPIVPLFRSLVARTIKIRISESDRTISMAAGAYFSLIRTYINMIKN